MIVLPQALPVGNLGARRVAMKHDKSTSRVRVLEGHEEESLLREHEPDDAWSEVSTTAAETGLSNAHLMRLYLSHFLSTWNSRCYEFAAVRAPLNDACFLLRREHSDPCC